MTIPCVVAASSRIVSARWPSQGPTFVSNLSKGSGLLEARAPGTPGSSFVEKLKIFCIGGFVGGGVVGSAVGGGSFVSNVFPKTETQGCQTNQTESGGKKLSEHTFLITV